MKRAVRLLKIIQLLNERAYTTGELAEHCGVSERAIQKDLADLRDDPLYLQLRQEIRYEYRLLGRGNGYSMVSKEG
jgi:predicted DNA-binding transcriptional regulator YafY